MLVCNGAKIWFGPGRAIALPSNYHQTYGLFCKDTMLQVFFLYYVFTGSNVTLVWEFIWEQSVQSESCQHVIVQSAIKPYQGRCSHRLHDPLFAHRISRIVYLCCYAISIVEQCQFDGRCERIPNCPYIHSLEDFPILKGRTQPVRRIPNNQRKN